MTMPGGTGSMTKEGTSMRGLYVLSGQKWLKHCTERFICYTARGEPQCTCGVYMLTWQKEAP